MGCVTDVARVRDRRRENADEEGGRGDKGRVQGKA